MSMNPSHPTQNLSTSQSDSQHTAIIDDDVPQKQTTDLDSNIAATSQVQGNSSMPRPQEQPEQPVSPLHDVTSSGRYLNSSVRRSSAPRYLLHSNQSTPGQGEGESTPDYEMSAALAQKRDGKQQASPKVTPHNAPASVPLYYAHPSPIPTTTAAILSHPPFQQPVPPAAQAQIPPGAVSFIPGGEALVQHIPALSYPIPHHHPPPPFNPANPPPPSYYPMAQIPPPPSQYHSPPLNTAGPQPQQPTVTPTAAAAAPNPQILSPVLMAVHPSPYGYTPDGHPLYLAYCPTAHSTPPTPLPLPLPHQLASSQPTAATALQTTTGMEGGQPGVGITAAPIPAPSHTRHSFYAVRPPPTGPYVSTVPTKVEQEMGRSMEDEEMKNVREPRQEQQQQRVIEYSSDVGVKRTRSENEMRVEEETLAKALASSSPIEDEENIFRRKSVYNHKTEPSGGGNSKQQQQQQQQQRQSHSSSPPPMTSSSPLPVLGKPPILKSDKRRRVQWTPELHARFEQAVSHVGLSKAVPKVIMQMMDVENLTRENVASHLQKYRENIKKRQRQRQEMLEKEKEREKGKEIIEKNGEDYRQEDHIETR